MSGEPERQLRSRGPVADARELPKRQRATHQKECMNRWGLADSIDDASIASLPIFDWAEKVLMQAREEGTAQDAMMATREGALTVQQSGGSSPRRAGEESHSVVPSSSSPKDEATRVIGDQAGTLALSQEEAEEDVADSFEEASE